MIREMKRSDLPRVIEIYGQGILEGGSTFETVCPTAEVWDGKHLPDCRYVAEKDGRIAGFAAVAATSPRACYRGVVEVSVYIDSAFRGHGIGTKLLQKLCAEAAPHGYWMLYSSIMSRNTASIQLHRKCGFREIGYRERIAQDRFGVWQNATLMEYRIKE